MGSPDFGCAFLPIGSGLGGSLPLDVRWDPLRLKLAPTAPFRAESSPLRAENVFRGLRAPFSITGWPRASQQVCSGHPRNVFKSKGRR